MTSSTANTILTGALTNLNDTWAVALPAILPTIITVAVLFFGYHALRRLWHRKV